MSQEQVFVDENTYSDFLYFYQIYFVSETENDKVLETVVPLLQFANNGLCL